MRIAAVIGHSGAGKTTLIAALIRHFAAAGQRVAAIKHTHHPLNEEHRGDTAKFEAAGADPVILAGDREAVVFTRAGTRRIAFSSPDDLPATTNADIVLIEGFKAIGAWPRISPLPLEEALEMLDRIWASQ